MLNLLFGKNKNDVAEGRKLVEGGATLLDVRTTGEFSGGHINGALNIPVQELGQRLAELGSKDEPIVVHCKSGGRSATAKSILQSAGFSKVVDVGGMPRW